MSYTPKSLYVNAVGGDTITGSLTVTPPGGSSLDGIWSTSTASTARVGARAAAGQNAGLQLNTSGSPRWFIGKTTTAESGGNAGSDLAVYRYSDAGAYLGNPISIRRSDGEVTVAANPTTTMGVVPKQYVDGRAPHRMYGGLISWPMASAGDYYYNITGNIGMTSLSGIAVIPWGYGTMAFSVIDGNMSNFGIRVYNSLNQAVTNNPLNLMTILFGWP